MKIFQTLAVAFSWISTQTLIFAVDVTDNLIPVQKGYLYELPTGDISTHFLPRFIDIFLKTSYTITVLMVVYAGGLYIYAQGEEEATGKAKDILIYGVVGFLIITVAYALVQGILNLEWFK